MQIEQIESIPRPVTMEDGGPVLMDLLWSDPTTNDAVQVRYHRNYSMMQYRSNHAVQIQ
jgi:hypothetical protein